MQNNNNNSPGNPGQNGNGNGSKNDFEIVVNAQPKTFKNAEVTYDQVVKLAFPDADPGQAVIFSVTFRHAASKPHAGELADGGSVEVKKKGTVFNVTRTVQS